MKYYLAARYSRIKEMQAVRDELEDRGHTVTSRWIDGGHEAKDTGVDAAGTHDECRRFATEDLNDIANSDILVAFTEAPRSNYSRGGRHVEFGYALGIAHIQVVVVGPRENVFHYLPCVAVYDTLEEFYSVGLCD